MEGISAISFKNTLNSLEYLFNNRRTNIPPHTVDDFQFRCAAVKGLKPRLKHSETELSSSGARDGNIK